MFSLYGIVHQFWDFFQHWSKQFGKYIFHGTERSTHDKNYQSY